MPEPYIYTIILTGYNSIAIIPRDDILSFQIESIPNTLYYQLVVELKNNTRSIKIFCKTATMVKRLFNEIKQELHL